MIDLCFSNKAFYVWNVEDIRELRVRHRIIGSLVGGLPALPRQNQLLGLPMQLTYEEANLLFVKKLARIIEYDELKYPISKELALQRAEMNKKSYHEQAVLFTMERKNQLMSVADKIIEGKRKKRGEPFDEKEALNEEIRKIPQMTEDFMMVQLFTRPHWKLNGQELLEMPYPNHSSIRCLVFIDLWDKGYYLTAGEKFGGDFLVYPGDPVKFHSHYIAVCISEDEPLNSQFLISKGRLGTNVKKTVLLCSVDAEGQMMYQSLQWESAIKQVK